MYITTNISKPASQPATQTECAAVCEQQLYGYISLLGLLFGIACLASYLAKKKFFLHVRSPKKKHVAKILSISFWVFLVLFILYFIKIEYLALGDGCTIDGLLLSGRLFPDLFPPIYSAR